MITRKPISSLLVSLSLGLLLGRAALAGSFWLNDAAGLSGPFACDGKMREAVWVNSGGRTIALTSALTWIGVQSRGKGDVWLFIHKLSSGEPLTFVAWDHYAEPTTLHQFSESFNPPFEIAPNDGLRIDYFCQASVKTAHIIIKVQHQ